MLGSVCLAGFARAGPPATYNWTGFYVGVDGGYEWSQSEWHNTQINGDYFVFDPTGKLFGGHVGYNWQNPSNLVLGFEADLAFGDVHNDNASFFDPSGALIGGFVGNAKIKSQGSGRVRLGFAADRFMPYVTGGIAFADYGYGLAVNATTYTASKQMMGGALGGGVEYAVSDKLSMRMQLLYLDFGAFDHGPFIDDQGVCCGAAYRVDLRTTETTFGLSLKL